MTTLGVVLGASTFQLKDLESSHAFKKAALSFVSYLQDVKGLAVEEGNILDLFDSPAPPSEQLSAIGDFLADQNSRSISGDLTVVFYYVGHGYIRNNTTDLHWAVAHTTEKSLYASSINYRDFFDIIKSVGANMKVFGIIDCCYAGSARGTMSNPSAVVQGAMHEALAASPVAGGCALICSATSQQRAYLLADDSSTAFTNALWEVVGTGWGTRGAKAISAHTLAGLVKARLAATNSPRTSTPEVYDVGQEAGVLSNEPFFPVLRNDNEVDAMPNTANGADWMPSDRDRLRATELHAHAVELLPQIAACLRGTQIHTSAYAYTHRAKTVDRILDKVERRIKDDKIPDYSIDHVTDVLGLRIISLFNEDLHPITMEVLDIILGDAGYHPNPLLAHAVRQIRIYSTAPIDNPTTGAARLRRKISDRLQSSKYADLDVEVAYRADYSSIHIVLDVHQDKPDQTAKGGSAAVVPVEIQIRTVFEDTWSRIDHVLRYSRSREKRTADATNVPVASERHLITLKALLDACANFAETIREELTTKTSGATLSLVPVEGQPDFVRMSTALGVEADVVRQVLELLQEKEGIDASRQTSGKGINSIRTSAQISERYGVAAEKFYKKLRELQQPGGYLAADKLTGASNQFVLYSLRMEEAYCRMLSNQSDEQQQAQRIYRELADVFEDVPVLLLRWGQACVKVADYDTAVQAYEKALRSFVAKSSRPIDDGDWQFTAEAKSFISKMLHRVYGYAYWKKFVARERRGEEAMAALRRAWEVTKEGIELAPDADGKLRSINNLLSYFTEMQELPLEARTGFADVLEDLDWLRRNYKILRDGVDVDNDERLEMIDTLVLVANILGESDAKPLAGRSVSLALQPGAAEHFGREVTDAAMRHAWAILNKSD